ncbi:MAG: hypothetical protein IDH49_08620 [Gammaproteobacteria bacterium]|nr:hypothetical protein [Gammaproteobacteria bacterium]
MTERLDTDPADTAANSAPPKRNRRRHLLRLALLGMVFLVISALIGAALWTWIGASGMNTVDAHLHAAKPWFMLWRVALFALVIGFWPQWTNWLAKRRRWPPERRQALLGLRWRVAAWWVVLELLLVQNLLGRALGY